MFEHFEYSIFLSDHNYMIYSHNQNFDKIPSIHYKIILTCLSSKYVFQICICLFGTFRNQIIATQFHVICQSQDRKSFSSRERKRFCELNCAKNNNIDTMMVETKILPA